MTQRVFSVGLVFALTLFATATGAGDDPDPVYPSPLAQVLRVDADGSNLQLVVPADVARAFSSLDVDWVNQRVYWSGFGESVPGPAGFIGRIRRANLDGSSVQDVNSGEASVRLDPGGGKMYYTVGSDCDPCTTVKRANLNGSAPETLASGVSNTPLALNPPAGKIYWYDQGNIVSANLDGSDQQVAFAVPDFMVDMRVDRVNQKLYWIGTEITAFSATLYRAELDGTQQEALVTGFDSPAKLTLDVAGDRLWWTEREQGTLKRARLDGSEVTTLRDDLDDPRGIAYVAGPGQDGGRLYFLGNPEIVYEPVPATSAPGIFLLLLVLCTASSLIVSRRRRTCD